MRKRLFGKLFFGLILFFSFQASRVDGGILYEDAGNCLGQQVTEKFE
jgi:hypothetical protein